MRKKLFCVHYHSLDSTQEQRVQLGMPLTVAENLNVNFSPRATLARELVDMVFPHDRGIAEIRSIPITTTRSKGYQIMVQVLCVLSRWDSYDEPSRDIPGLFGTPPQTAWLQQTITRHYAAKMKGKSKAKMDVDGDSDMEEEEYEEVQPVPVTPEFRERMKAVADVLVKMAKDPRCAILFAKHAFSQTVSPMAFIGWFLLAYHGRQTLSEKQLLNLCLLMRIQLHKKHPGEVKTNSRCGETLIIFITEALKDPDGLISKGEETGLFNWAGMRLTEDGSIDMETSARPSRKRKQRDEEHESEDPKKTKKSRVANRQPTTTAIPSPTPPKRVSRKGPNILRGRGISATTRFISTDYDSCTLQLSGWRPPFEEWYTTELHFSQNEAHPT
ncbi:hypothetical protein MPER_10263 [Moniliophthora perniciosa FA553]|nr:hypothetical protein MPER_10263 [Moniliophthora perniciosa FA553]